MPKLDKAERRDKQREKKRRGMRVVGKSIFTIQEARKQRDERNTKDRK